MFKQLESFVGVIWSLVLALKAAAEQQGEEPEDFIQFLQTRDGKILVPGMVEFVVMARRGKKPGKPVSRQLEEWRIFYKKFFNYKLDVESIRIPTRLDGYDRLIVVAKGFTLNQIYAAMAKQFTCSSYADDLDKVVIHNARDANRDGTYAVWVRDQREADKENRSKSAYDLWGTKNPVFVPEMPFITLGERMLYELKHWDETGDQLDQDSWTQCLGSRGADGDVLCVRFAPGYVHVSWSGCLNSGPDLGARSAVSRPLEPSGAQA
ncbi:MAG TPA: hypothetical protein VI937_02465 [Negativicutes bacterium]|uniref:Uncharacterized protein n=1 Tax=Candidatus Staskawiczbacteria bacterium RIFCSPHIGHO2_01_FULL_41_41 TaxID=1802203 RepID=A0A1G2HUY9_9BACT|nr:MAG: hypothetical protein A2822_02205 [Candidatus Staskawiczbacteria bacterium RIFCSPHIGHO2_01_FULL_41_41]OGZ69137.1 MAG: hypothetical protein A3C50_01945 [Candidatus Staskawiczbacteria bacterium RIFCSPHIGHO2_02_FULL_43_16]OGZ74435.1 MAG: hypothetical protein A3A12_01545 [Candidatus Staskawiczbacteria bacterium RIFCSPLOWO2_01_FULL_43_17b]HLD70720.1 hypothetical protein [Negativicutes bacterium]